jgi:GH24 family phage-related lysozyme (muramidase)
MAIKNYGRALGQIAQESVKGSVQGFAMGIKGAALREMPGLTAMYGLSREVKNRANKLGDASVEASVKEQRTNNVISIEMVRQLRSINNNVLQQTRISALQANNAKQTAMFAEESDREKAQRDKELLDAIKALKGGPGATGILGSAGAGAGGGKGFLGSLLDALQTASLLEALGVLAGGKYILDKGKTIFGKGGGGVPTTGGAGGKPPTGGQPPASGGGKVIPFPQGGRGGGSPPTVPPTGGTGGAGGGLLRGGAGLAARSLLRFIPYVGVGLIAAELGYEAYKLIFSSQGGQGPKPRKPGGGGGGQLDYSDLMTSMQGAPLGDNALGGGLSQSAQKVLGKGKYGVGAPRRRSGAVTANAAEFITGKEGFVGKATKDTNRMAIGYGHNITDAEIKAGEIDLGGGDKIKISGEGGRDTTVTKEQANKLFTKDSKKFEDIIVASIGQEAYNKLSTNQRTAILSYAYNTGSIPKNFKEAIQSGNMAAAAASIRNGVANVDPSKVPGWSKEKIAQVNDSLKKRREDEAKLFDIGGGVGAQGRTGSVATKTSANVTPVSRSGVTADDSTQVDAEIRRAANSGYYTQRETDANTQRVLRELGGSSTQSRSASGSVTRGFVGPIQVEDKKANAILGQQLKTAKVVARETATVAKSTTPRETRRQTTLLQRANQTFLNQFQNTTQRLLSKAIYDTLVVGAYGKEGSRNLVSKQQTQGEVFRGQQVSKMLGLNKGTEKVLTSVFGKQIGKAYAPMVAQLGTAYLEVGATKVGRDLFSTILGSDKNADALTGQILGNFARGNKQVATEQLLYGLTGVASGPETIFAKYGFGSSQQGANFLGGYGAAQITAPIAGMLGGNQPTYRGPDGRQMYGAGQTPMMQPATQQGAYYTGMNARGNQQNFVNPEMMRLAVDADKAARESLPHISDAAWKQLDQAKTDLKLKTEQYLEAKVDTAEFETARAAQAQAQARLTERTNEILASKPSAVGGGSSAGGNFMSSMGNFAFDLGTSLVASKLTQNIKNPYLKAFANFGVTSAASSFIRPMIFGAPTIAGAAAAPSLFTASNAASLGSSLLPSSSQGFAGTAGTILANSGYTTAGSFMGGVQSGMNATLGGQAISNASATPAFAAGELVGEYLPYAQAILYALKGDFKKAATTAAGTYAGTKAGAYIGSFFGPGGTVIGATIGAVVGSIFGSSIGRKPKPAVLRVTSTTGNEVSAVTAWSKDSPPEAWSKFADVILIALLNSAKLMQQMSKGNLPFVNIGVYVDSQSGISLCLYQDGEATNTSALPKWNKNFGSIASFKMGTAITGMIEYMRDCLKEGKDSITADKLDQATKELKSKNITALTSGVLNELKTGGQYDLSKGVGYDSGKPTSTGRTIGEAKGRSASGAVGSINTSSDSSSLTTAKTNSSASSLVPSAGDTTTVSNSAPMNSVVAVGGSSQIDNSTSITHINQMSFSSDSWRRGSINTDYQLAA